MKIRVRFVVMMLLFLVLLSTSVFARPSVTGPTGLVTMPTAEALKYKEFNVGYDYLFGKTSSQNAWFYKSNVGTFKNWELGVVGGSTPQEGMFLNAKYFLMSDETRYPVMVAIGLENISSSDLTDMYMVASKRFQGGFSAHFGFKAIFADSIDPSIMAGLDYVLNDKLTLLGDISGSEKHYTLNAGVDFALTNDFQIRGTFLDITSNSVDKFRMGVGFAYTTYL
jgi:hypothetical protein